MGVIFANDKLEELCKEKSQIVLWGNGFLGKTVYKENIDVISGGGNHLGFVAGL